MRVSGALRKHLPGCKHECTRAGLHPHLVGRLFDAALRPHSRGQLSLDRRLHVRHHKTRKRCWHGGDEWGEMQAGQAGQPPAAAWSAVQQRQTTNAAAGKLGQHGGSGKRIPTCTSGTSIVCISCCLKKRIRSEAAGAAESGGSSGGGHQQGGQQWGTAAGRAPLQHPSSARCSHSFSGITALQQLLFLCRGCVVPALSRGSATWSLLVLLKEGAHPPVPTVRSR